MGRKSEAAMSAAKPESLEMDAPVTVQARPEQWSTRRMLAVSALVSAVLWTLIVLTVAALVD